MPPFIINYGFSTGTTDSENPDHFTVQETTVGSQPDQSLDVSSPLYSPKSIRVSHFVTSPLWVEVGIGPMTVTDLSPPASSVSFTFKISLFYSFSSLHHNSYFNTMTSYILLQQLPNRFKLTELVLFQLFSTEVRESGKLLRPFSKEGKNIVEIP